MNFSQRRISIAQLLSCPYLQVHAPRAPRAPPEVTEDRGKEDPWSRTTFVAWKIKSDRLLVDLPSFRGSLPGGGL